MRWNDLTVIAKREYTARIRSKAFWISTIALPLLMGTWMVIPGLIMSKSRSTQKLAVVDATGEVAEALLERLGAGNGARDRQVSFEIERVAHEEPADELRARLDERVLSGEIQAWLWLEADSLAENRVEYHAENVSNVLTQDVLEDTLSAVVRRNRLEAAGYDAETIASLTRRVRLDTLRVSAEGSRADRGIGGLILAVGLFMILYMTTLLYGNQVMLGVLEEKSSRVVEVVVSAVRPLELMLGKLFGIGAIGLTQLGIWIAAAVAFTTPGLVGAVTALPEGVELPQITAAIVVHFLLLFLLGYFLYATFYAMLGAAFNNPQEAQQMATVAVIFVVLPWAFFMPILNDPDSTLAVVTSLIPMFTPTLMMLRIAVKMPPWWQIALGYVLTGALCLALTWVCSRIYRVGILMYGKKPTLKELWRWARHA